jgi:sugar lactone lactonase YvrE
MFLCSGSHGGSAGAEAAGAAALAAGRAGRLRARLREVTDLRTVPLPESRIDARDLVPPDAPEAVVLGEARARLGERPLHDARDGSVVWVDIDGRSVHRWAGGDHARDAVTSVPSQVSLAWPAAAGGLLLATADGIGVHDGTTLGPVTRPEDMPADYRFNDGGVDGAGRLWIATMPKDGSTGDGTVYRVTAGPSGALAVESVITGVGVGNGLQWSPDGSTLYVTDTGTSTVYRLPFDVATGAVGEPSAFLSFAPGGPKPDGTTVDADGCLWVALYGGGAVLRFAPDGTPLGAVRVRTAAVTCLGFGAPGSGRAYVTTAHADGDPLAGAVFGVDVAVDGVPARAFGAG